MNLVKMHMICQSTYEAIRWLKFFSAAMLIMVLFVPGYSVNAGENVWVHSGFEDFVQGQFEDGGSNLYVNAHGIIETINRLDVNNDGYVDLVLANSHDYTERGPTYIFSLSKDDKKEWKYQELPHDSGWMSRIIDLDRDGFNDMIVVNGENGVTSNLPSYVYWGEPEGIGTERIDLQTTGAYDLAVMDINRDGRLDLIFPSAWEDHHNPGKPMLARVYLADKDRKFLEATETYGIEGIAAVSIAEGDLNNDGFHDLVLGNYRNGFDYNIESFIYWGTNDGLNTIKPTRLPTYMPIDVKVSDLNSDGWDDVIFSGGNQVKIYWNKKGNFSYSDYHIINAEGYTSMASIGRIFCEVADLNDDGQNELIMTTKKGLQIRSVTDLEDVQTFLPLSNIHWVTACDLNGDGRKDLIVSRYDDEYVYDTKSPIYWNGPSGFSSERVTWFTTKGAVGNTAGDLDGDGQPEVVFNNTMSGHIKGIYNYIYLGDRDGKYGIEHRLDLPTDGSAQCAIADLDIDGYPEVIFTEGNQSVIGYNSMIRIYHGCPEGPVQGQCTDIPTTDGLRFVNVADFNRDGYLDLFFTCMGNPSNLDMLKKSTGILYGSKKGFSKNRLIYIETFAVFGASADVNKDGYLDILLTDQRNKILIYLGGDDGYSNESIWEVPCKGLAHAGTVNIADLNNDGFLDLIVGTMGHYSRIKDTFTIFYGSAGGYDPENSQKYYGGYSPIGTAVADFNRDGNLDVVITGYSSPTERVIPAQLFWGNGKTLDLNNPVNLPSMGSAEAVQVDLNRDGWVDLFLSCHRNDLGHRVNSLIYWNGPEGFSTENVADYWNEPEGFSTDSFTGFPGLGPHGTITRNHGNAYTRKPEESYISPPYDMHDQTAVRIHWNAEVPPPSKLRFQLRWADTKEYLKQAKWMGSRGENTYFEKSGEQVSISSSNARWLQYRAIFVSPYGCRSPKLREVRVVLKPMK